MELATTKAEVPVYSRLGIEINEGQGVEVTSSTGERYLDFYGGHATALLGYGHPALVRALREQADRLFFQTNLVDVAIRTRAHERLVELAPAGLTKVFLVNSGAEANENALRLALRATGRTRVLALEGAFHGRTAASAAVTYGSEKWYGFPRTPFDVTWIPLGDLPALERALAGGDVAALIVEAVQGVQGALDVPIDFLQEAHQRVRRAGALLIADEIQCGMGRTGKIFAIEHAGVDPDLVTTAKGLAGGFPAGAVLMTEAVAATVGTGDLGTTFGGGPLAAALIVAVADELSVPGFLDHVTEMGARVRETCQVGPVSAIQGRGLLVGLRCDRPAAQVVAGLRDQGILAGTSKDPAVVRLMPPLVIERQHVDALAAALSRLGG
ncbi:MAG: aminotransferase class III-fold pyridoxal phosphate-dependent enzyme [Gemmatimonadota bacterium]